MNLRRLYRGGARGSAATARERLLKDRTLRRNRFQAPPATPFPVSAPLTVPQGKEHPSPDRREAQLSPYAQKWHVIATARHFRKHYLAEMAYDERRHITVAIIRPYLAHAQAGEVPFKIRVNGKGDTVVVRLEEENDGPNRFTLRRVFVTLFFAAVFVGGTLALFL